VFLSARFSGGMAGNDRGVKFMPSPPVEVYMCFPPDDDFPFLYTDKTGEENEYRRTTPKRSTLPTRSIY
jgi:hypothetical protein